MTAHNEDTFVIESEETLDKVIDTVDKMLSDPKTIDEKHLDNLSGAIIKYEDVAYPTPEIKGVQMLRELIKLRGCTLTSVAKGSGICLSVVSKILSNKRKLNSRHIEKLAKHFGVTPDTF